MNHPVMRAIVGTSIVFTLVILGILNVFAPEIAATILFVLSVISFSIWLIWGLIYVLDGPKS